MLHVVWAAAALRPRLTRRVSGALLPLNTEGELNDTRIVRLAAQILKSSHIVWGHVNRMIKNVEEVSGKTRPNSLCDCKRLEHRKILVKGTGPTVEVSSIPIHHLRDRSQADSAIGQ